MIRFKLFFSIALLCLSLNGFTQSGKDIPTKGKEFWLGFMHNFKPKTTDKLDLFVSSLSATSGTVTIPGTGYSQAFTVAPNVTTTVTIPNNLAEVLSSEVVEKMGILVETQDTVSLFAINFKDHTADASKILPVESLGTDYMIVSYESLQGSELFPSEMLIVASQDGTEVEITPTATTEGGHAAGVPFIVQLDKGDAYQVKSIGTASDLTGSRIRATEKSGECRAFAVFSGVRCANIPIDCAACDHIFDQNFPVATWGTDYYTIPYENTSSHLIRILAAENNTSVRIDNGAPQLLQSGQFLDIPNASSAMYVSGNKPISVVQFAKGVTCVGTGDPAMLFLNSDQERIFDVTFSTVQSGVINTHNLNVITETIAINQLILDGISVNPSEFIQYPANPQFSYATISLTEGSHTLQSPNGFTAYVYGTGSAESYTYSVGSFSPGKAIDVDSVLCSASEITIGPKVSLFSPWWSRASAPDDTIATGLTYTFTPTASETFIVKGNSIVSGCEKEFAFSVGLPDPPTIDIVASDDTISACQLQPVNLNVLVSPTGTYDYQWTPSTGVDNPTTSSVTVRPIGSSWYKVRVSSNGGCSWAEDSIYISVVDGNIASLEIDSPDLKLCRGDSTQLSTLVEQIVLEDDFDTGISPSVWGNVLGASTNNNCGAFSGDALYFNGVGSRVAETVAINTSTGGTIRFVIKIANGTFPCDDVDFGEDIVLEYSTNGVSWVEFHKLFEFQYATETFITIDIPDVAKAPSTRFRWRQLSNSGVNQDNWLLDNVSVSVVDYSNVTFDWNPKTHISSSNSRQPIVYPQSPTFYEVQVINNGCTYSDSVFVDVGDPFGISITNDTIVCDVTGIQLDVIPDAGTGHTISWVPGISLNDSLSFTPISTPKTTTTYTATVTSEQGCVRTGNVEVRVGSLVDLSLSASDVTVCLGDSIDLEASLGGNGLQDNFDGGIDMTQWQSVVGAVSGIDCGSVSGDALYFAGTTREAITNSINTSSGGTVDFSIKFGSGSGACENADAGEDVVLEYSLDGINWIIINTYDEALYTVFTSISEPIPVAAQSASTQFRFRQLSFSGSGNDIFVIDDVRITGGARVADFDFQWTPASTLLTPSLLETKAIPTAATTYNMVVTERATGCVLRDSISVNVGTKFPVSSSSDTILCSVSGIALGVTHGAGLGATYHWSPGSTLSDSTIRTPIATPSSTTQYTIEVTSADGCNVIDSLEVRVSNPVNLQVITANHNVCIGDTALLVASLGGTGLEDDFDGGIDMAQWQSITGGISSIDCGSVSGDALYFSGTGREAVTIPLNTSSGGTIDFSIKFGSGSGSCENADAGEDVVLEYSIDGINWVVINTYDEALYTVFTSISEPIPAAAQSASTQFRFRQLSFSGSGNDIWVLDNLAISGGASTNDYTFQWSPTVIPFSTALDTVKVVPIGPTTYNVLVTEKATGCVLEDSIALEAGVKFPISTTPDTILCSVSGIGIGVSHGAGSGASYNWTPGVLMSDSTISNPVAIPNVTTVYEIEVTSADGCVVSDSVEVKVSNPVDLNIIASSVNICLGDSALLIASLGGTGFEDDFDGGIDMTQWQSVTGGISSIDCGSVSGDALYFSGIGREAITNPLNTLSGGTIDFSIKFGSGSGACENADSGEDVVLEYSLDGINWVVINTYDEALFTVFTSISEPIPVAAQSSNTQFRFRQLSFSGSGNDIWVLDNVMISGGANPMDYTYQWNPLTFGVNTVLDSVKALPLVTTTYSVVVTEKSTGCVIEDSIEVLVGDRFNLSTSPDTMLCSVAGIGIDVIHDAGSGASYIWSPGVTLSDSLISNPIASPKATTTYVVTVTSLQGCSLTDSVEVRVSNPIDLQLAASDIAICQGDSIWLTSSLGGTGLVDKFDGGIDMAQWQSITGGISSTDCGSVTGDALYFSGIGREAVTKVLNTNAGGNVSFSIKFGSGSGACENADAGEDVVLEYSIDGINWVIINTYDEALFTVFTSISEPIPLAAQSSTTQFRWRQLSFSGSGNDIWVLDDVEISGAAQTSDYLFSWSPSSLVSNPTLDSTVAFPVVNTTFVLNVTEKASGCVIQDSLAVTVSVPFTVQASNDTILCSASGLQLGVVDNAGIGATYSWSPSSSLTNPLSSSPLANPLSSTVYTVEVTNITGCTVTDTVSVSVTSLVDLKFDVDNPVLCTGDSTLIVVTLGGVQLVDYNLQWSPSTSISSLTNDSVYVNPISPTFYKLEIEEKLSGCILFDSVFIDRVTPAILDLGLDQSICTGDSLLLNASVIQSSLLWSNNATSSQIYVSQEGDYWVQGLDFNGCSVFDSISVTLIDLPIIGLPDSVSFCENTTTQLQASGGINYTWLPALFIDNSTISNPVVNPPIVTDYIVNVENVDGCSTTDTITVSPISTPLIDFKSNDTICFGETLILTAGDFKPVISYQWQDGSSLKEFSVVNSGMYWVEVTTICGNFRDSIDVEVLPKPVVTIGPISSLCLNDDSVVVYSGTSSMNNGVGTYYLNHLPSQSRIPITYFNPAWGDGNHTVSYEYVVSGCSGTDSTTFIVHALPQPLLSIPTTCIQSANLDLMSYVSNVVNGSGVFSGSLISSNMFDMSLADTGFYDVEYLHTSSDGCQVLVLDSIRIEGENPQASVTNIAVCSADGEITFEAQFNGNEFGLNPTFNWTLPNGTKRVTFDTLLTLKVPNEIVDGQNVELEIIPSSELCLYKNYQFTKQQGIADIVQTPDLGLLVIDTVCINEKFDIELVGGADLSDSNTTIRWFLNGDTLSNYKDTFVGPNPAAGNHVYKYEITTRDHGISCISVDSAIATSVDLDLSLESGDIKVSEGTSTLLTVDYGDAAGEVKSIKWMDVSNGSSLSGSQSEIEVTPTFDDHMYQAILESAYCLDTIAITIGISFICPTPNAFSPNGDGYNEKWYIECLEDKNDVLIQVYNRWGNKVFENFGNYTSDKAWDGKGYPVGTYYYIIRFGNDEGIYSNQLLQGAVTITR